jgi:hypothetical protein
MYNTIRESWIKLCAHINASQAVLGDYIEEEDWDKCKELWQYTETLLKEWKSWKELTTR